MERDFMGLNSRVVKEEFVEGGFQDSGFARSSGVTWLFPHKFSAFSPPKSDRNEKQISVQHFPVKHAGSTSSSLVFGATEHRASTSPPQLTIFYGGSVSVFDNITPEKAKAIMCLAGKWASPSPPCPDQQKLPAIAVDHVLNSSHGSPISVSSRPTDVPVNDIELVKMEPPKMRPTSAIVSTAVPQARKASLARFLQKRKERNWECRVMSTAPYTMDK